MSARFEISERQWQALGLDGGKRAVAKASWESLGYFRLLPNTRSASQRKLGEGLVVPSLDAAGELVVVYHSLHHAREVAKDPGAVGLFFTLNKDAEFWLIDGRMEWPVDSLEVACQPLIEISKGLGMNL